MTHDILAPLLARRSLLAAAAAAGVLPCVVQAQTPPADGSAAGGATLGGKEITVDGARNSPIPVAIPPVAGGDLGRQISEVITNNLRNCGLFRPIDPAAFIGDAGSDKPNFDNWKATGAQAVMTGKLDGSADRVRVEFRLWDVLPGTQIQGTAYTGAWRRIAHIISDAIYERLLGEKGYFDTRVVYVAGSGPRGRRTKRLAIMDQDGANVRYLTDGTWNALTPRFHPSREEIAFMSYANNKPRVYLFNLGGGGQRSLGDFGGITLSPRFSPDGGNIVMAQTRGGGSDIMVVGAGGGGARQLTSSGAIDVSPCYSPDGAQIVFNSDRGGDQQIYVMGAGGGGARRISFGRGQYATPVWSPRGDLIAFTRFAGGTFAIGVMHPDGSGERTLSESYFVEGPTFAPNGRVLMFTRETAARDSTGGGYSARLVSIDVAGFNERPVPTATDASDADWSPLQP